MGANNIGGPNPDFEKYVILGETFLSGNFDLFLARREKCSSSKPTETYRGNSPMGKDIVVAGHTRSFGAGLHDFLLLKTDSLGNLQWVKTYGGPNEDWAYSVYEAHDPGSTESFGAGLKDLPFPSPTDFRYGFCPRGLYPILRRGITGL
jgi:hypothetical protein